jgi:universal stress protein A
VALGAPAHEIRAAAEEVGADLIVLGTHGRHGLGLLLGSTANGVLHGATSDVLAVRVRFEE